MKIKRILFILIFIAFFILTLSGNKSKAKTMDTPIYLGTQEFRTDSDPENMGYAINDPDTNGSTSGGNIKGAKLWKIVKYSSPSATTYDNSIDYYCIRAGIGFRNTDGKVLYNVSYDFKKDKSQLQSSANNILKILSSDNVYYKLLAISDLMYIKGESTTQERTELIEKACSSVGIDVEDFAVGVTNSDIEAVQQAALWYFTNQDETENFSQIYDQLGMENQQWLRYKIKGENSYRPLSDYDGSGLEGEQRQIQAIAIYNYLINTTIKNEQSYKNGTARSRSIITLYANATDFNEQPVIVIEKEPAEFDLALRKYITKVNGTNVNISRNPVIDKSTLNTGTTATYKHKKDPVKVKYGDIVTYNITIYNEGDIDGRARKIIDQLPTGLKFSKVNTSGYTPQYDEETNQVTLIKNTENNLKAYDGENLSSETIEIECTVETVKGEILTNVAWITEEIDANGTVITTEKGKDRDSEPGTKPNVNKDNMTDYKGNTSNKTDLTDTNYFYKGEQDDDDFEKLITETITGNYQVQLEKVDLDNKETKLQGAEFEVTLPGKTKETKTTNENGIIDLGIVEITEIANKDTITIKETKAPEGYNKILDTLTIEVEKQLVNGSYSAKNVTIKSGEVEGTSVRLEGNTIKITIGNVQKEFDLALRKYITKVNGTNVNISRNPVIDKSTLNTGTTATYKHKKDPVKVKYGDIVTYNITIYNEGDIDGRARKIIDQLPTGLKFSKVNTSGYTPQYDEETNQVTLIKNTENNLKAYDGENLSSETIEIECTVETVKGEILTNVAWITEEIDANGTVITTEKGKDRDSEPGTKPNVNKDNMTDYKGNTSNKTDLTDTNYFYKGEQDDDDFEKLITETITGNYQVQLEKVDLDNKEIKLQGAEFEVTLPEKQKETKTTNENGIIELGTVEITEIANKDTITIKETKAPEGYNKILDTLEIEVEKQLLNGSYSVKNVVLKSGQEEGTNIALEGNVIKITVANKLITGNYQIQLEKVDSDNPETKLQGAEFEITVPGKAVETKTTNENGIIELGTVAITDITKKDTITVKETKAPKGYNQILDTLTIEVEKQIENDEYKIKEAKIISGQVEGTSVQINGNTIKIIVANKKITGNYQVQLEKVDKDNTIKKLQGAEFEITVPGKTAETKKTNENGIIDLETIEITEIESKDTITVKETKAPEGYNKIFDTLEIEIEKQLLGGSYSVKNAIIKSGEVEGTKITLVGNTIKITVANIKKEFDLSLRKYISQVNNIEYNREPTVDTSNLGNGNDSTAIYNHPKTEVSVNRNDVVIYTIRIYNEGEIDGYANEITDYLPEELEFLVDNEINKKYEWVIEDDGRTVKTDYLSKEKETQERENLIKAFDSTTLAYKEIQIACRVKEEAKRNIKLTNIAEITKEVDEKGEKVKDRDSEENNINLPPDEERPEYKDDEIEKEYVPGQQDDDDFEKVIVKEFDLALRKFITKVDEKEVTTRIPEVSYNEEKEQIEYNHTKEPVEVITDNIVTYTIRIFNEGDISGYAKEVADDLPEGLEFLPDSEINQEYRWVMYDAEGNVTENVEEAEKIVTDYLSKEQGEARMEEDSTLEENPNLLQAFNPEEEISETNPDYRDVKVAFKVIEPNTSDKILVNSAQIQEDEDENGNPVDDIDSTPGEWNEGEDDQDKEYVKLTYFDLSLRKWVTQAIVIENGKETITQTGHTAEMDPEPVVKVELHRKKLDQVTVKFRYSIRVTNEGDIAGYAKEITDYVPEGLRFIAEDNPGWTDEGNNVISTRLLENTLLQPGESAEVEVLLTWINGSDNLGLKTNTAEISEDYNDKGAPDIDSTPDNKVPGEDDIDDAEVILSISTGQARIYYTLGFIVLTTIGGGIFLIKRYVI